MPEPRSTESPADRTGTHTETVETTAASAPIVDIEQAPDPDVAIVIVTYGTGSIVVDALASVAEHTGPAFEVVVVDNPTEGRAPTSELLRERTSGVRLVVPDRNLGFGGGNAAGVAHTTAELICFLNPDVIVVDGWLEPLVAALDDPAVGIAGPVLLNTDGTIQEAGRVVYADGWTGAVAGRDLLTGDASQLFSRDVDYVSAACWVVRRGEHLARGGFDDRYHPAFFEDVDYALRVESEGQRTRLVVDVPVVHEHGGGGAGRDATPFEPHARFCAAWTVELAARSPCPGSDAEARQARDRLADERLALVDRAGSRRAARRGLAEAARHARVHPRDRVVFVTPVARGLALDAARRAGVEVVVGEVESVLAERSDELTARRDVVAPPTLMRRDVRQRWLAIVGLSVLLALGALLTLVGAARRSVVPASAAGGEGRGRAWHLRRSRSRRSR